jgi:hypothetical protein
MTRAAVTAGLLLGWVGVAAGQTREVTGQTGVLGEWEITATMTEQTAGDGSRLAGPVTLRHVGFCSVDGPEEKVGELRLQVTDAQTVEVGARVAATLLVEGTECSFQGRLNESYEGVLHCPDRRDVPMSLSLR